MLVRVSARFELARVRVLGSRLYQQSDNCKIKETLFIQELKPSLNVNISSEKLSIIFCSQSRFQTPNLCLNSCQKCM